MRAIYKWSSVLALWILAMVPSSAETLHAGMSGDAVTALQNSLVAAGYLARTVDGDYGSTTKEAVYLFQKDKGLTATGEAMMRPEMPFDVPKAQAIGMVGASCMQKEIAEM